MIPFVPFPKMARLSREVFVTEKLDGTNGSISIVPASESDPSDPFRVAVVNGFAIYAGSRNRWLTPENDNYGFAGWVTRNAVELVKLGPGTHFGEWFGLGIQRGYGLTEKRFSLFNASRWRIGFDGGVMEYEPVKLPDGTETLTPRFGPSCVSVVPTLYRGPFDTSAVDHVLADLKTTGSIAAPGFADPEGVIVYHVAAGIGFKKTYNDSPKGASK